MKRSCYDTIAIRLCIGMRHHLTVLEGFHTNLESEGMGMNVQPYTPLQKSWFPIHWE